MCVYMCVYVYVCVCVCVCVRVYSLQVYMCIYLGNTRTPIYPPKIFGGKSRKLCTNQYRQSQGKIFETKLTKQTNNKTRNRHPPKKRKKRKKKNNKIKKIKNYILLGGESNPGLPRDRRRYSPLYYQGFG